jgi:hypothetical protein
MCPTQQPGLGARVPCAGSLSCSYGQASCCGVTTTAQTCVCQHGFFFCGQTVECNVICPDAGHD